MKKAVFHFHFCKYFLKFMILPAESRILYTKKRFLLYSGTNFPVIGVSHTS